MTRSARLPSSTDAHDVWEREMRRLAVHTRLLIVVLLAIVARILLSGLTVVNGIAALICASLALATLLLSRYGHRHEP